MATTSVQYVGDGAVTNFSVTFSYISKSDVSVTVNGASASFTWFNASTITVSPAPAVGTTVAISRTTPTDEPVIDFQNGAVVTEDQLNVNSKQALFAVQELKGTTDALNTADQKALRVPDGALMALPSVNDRRNKIVAFDDLGNPIVSTPAFVTGNIEFAARADAILSTISSPINYIRTNGYLSAGDNGGGLYAKVSSQPTHSAKFQTVGGQWWELQPDGYVRPEQFGWVPGGDLRPALQAMFDYCAVNKTKEIRLFTDKSNPGVFPGAYRIKSGFNINVCINAVGSQYTGVRLVGLGKDVTHIEYDQVAGGSPRTLMVWTDSDPWIKGITFDGREQDRIARTGLALGSDVDASVTTIPFANAANLDNAGGTFKIDNEWIYYNGKSGNNAINCQRGVRGTIAAAHTAPASVFYQPRTGHGVLAIQNFRHCTLRDIGSLNSIGYGISGENTDTDYVEHYDIQDIYIENTGSDGMDFKCPVQNGNKYTIIRNYIVKGWARETTWGNNTNDNGIDCRFQGVRLEGFTAIFTPYMGKATAINLRENQINNGTDPVGDFSGGHFTVITDAHFLGYLDTPGSAVVQHNGITASSDHVVVQGAEFRWLTGAAVNCPGDDNILTNLQIYMCNQGVQLSGSNNKLSNSKIINCVDKGVWNSAGTNNEVTSVDIRGSGAYGVYNDSGGTVKLTNTTVSGSGTADYQLSPTCIVRKTVGAIKTVTATYTASTEDYTLLADATAGAFTITLQSITQVIPGREYIIQKIDSSANAVTLDPAGSNQIKNASTYSLTTQWQTARIVNDGNKWYVL